MATSVWMNGRKSPVSRCLALTMPAVTVFSRPNGEPIAMTHSPTFSRDTSPIFTAGSPLASIFTTATSVRLSKPTRRALNSRLSVSVTSTSSAPSTTCAFVITKPSVLRMKSGPDPPLLRLVVAARPSPRVGASGHRYAEAPEELLQVRIDVGAGRGSPALERADVDDRRAPLLGQFGEVGQLAHLRRTVARHYSRRSIPRRSHHHRGGPLIRTIAGEPSLNCMQCPRCCDLGTSVRPRACRIVG